MTEKYFVKFMDENLSDVAGLTLQQAQAIAADHVGNNSPAKPFPSENIFFYGPGDGTTTVVVRKEWKNENQ